MNSKKIKFPDPMALALGLTAIVFILGLWSLQKQGGNIFENGSKLILGWYNGLWDTSTGGLYFVFQMILILVLGHALALSSPVKNSIQWICRIAKTNTQAILMIAFLSVFLGYLNWGLALVLSALMVKEFIARAAKMGEKINIGLLGASAYLCMVVWHGGLSGSSPTKASEPEAIRSMLAQAGYSAEKIAETIPISETLFSTMNLSVVFLSLIALPLTAWMLNSNFKRQATIIEPELELTPNPDQDPAQEKSVFILFIGIILIVIALWLSLIQEHFFNINYINFVLLGLCFIAHRSIQSFSKAVQISIQDASGILIQFPLYFGIIGLMKASGLTILLSEFIVQNANSSSFHVLSFISAGILNFFIPSGGGQFYIQGPILLDAAQNLNVSFPQTIMAISYGDQWTNMLQPFWALPLIGITKIKLSALLPYCFAFFVVTGIIFACALLCF